MNFYKDICKLCKSPALKKICSNRKCKSWKKYKNIIPPKLEIGASPENAIEAMCPKCKSLNCFFILGTLKCRDHDCGYNVAYDFIEERWYKDAWDIRKYIGGDSRWHPEIIDLRKKKDDPLS